MQIGQRTVHNWRELTNEEIEYLLGKHSHGRLGLCVNGEPYVVPVAFKYSDGAIYFHSAKRGKKLESIRKNNRVCFEIDEWEKAWASVICYGRVTLRDDVEAKRKGLELLAGQALPEDRIESAPVYIGIIDIDELTGRCSTDYTFQ
ncbi:MAG TPA: pyridoxamine 5'-phosphate oxidase family protein [Dehalococcoidia bacterium]|nr:pyridoxamine 5'-phosphate oxidase family protein [Dehalococcoidia bacterium]